MVHKKRILCGLIALVLSILVLPVPAEAKDFPEVLADTKKGVAQIYALGDDGVILSSWVGTGFAVGKQGKDSNTFLTNWHVVTGSGEYEVSDVRIWILQENCSIDTHTGEPDPKLSYECEVLKTTSGYPDYAVIRAKESIKGYKALPLLSSKEVPDGATVYALGYPAIVGSVSVSQYGIDDITSTNGIISQHMQYILAENTWVLMHTAQISGGNSGGPLINEDGAVIGLNTYGFGEQDSSINRFCAVYIDYAMEGLDSLDIDYTIYGEEQKGILDKIKSLLKGDEAAEEKESNGSLAVVIGVILLGCCATAVVVILVWKKKKDEKARAEAEERCREWDRQEALRRQEEERRRQEQQRKMELERFRLRGPNGQIYPVGNGGTIGREAGCTITLPANTPGVSRVHCKLEVRGDQLILRDQNSSYGTYIHGKRIPANTPVALKSGSSFSLGSEKCTFTVC